MKSLWMVLINIINVCVDIQQKSMMVTTTGSSVSESICDKVCERLVTDR